MSTAENNHLRTINWRESLPWLIIFRTFSAAVHPTPILLAFLGAILTPLGWFLFDVVLISNNMKGDLPAEQLAAKSPEEQFESAKLNTLVERMRSPYESVFIPGNQRAPDEANGIRFLDPVIYGKPASAFFHIADPLIRVFDQGTPGFRVYLYLFMGSMWTLAVWAFFGVGICRSAVLKFTREEPIGPIDAVMFSVRHFLSSLSAVGIPLLCVLLLAIPGLIAGLFLLFDFGTIIAGIFWFVVLGCGFVMAILLVGLFFAWPLMIPAVSTDEVDGFDAMARGYSYIFARPLGYLFYTLLALAFGALCYWIATIVLGQAINLSIWSASWTASVSDPPDFTKVETEEDAQDEQPADDSDNQPKTRRLNDVFTFESEPANRQTGDEEDDGKSTSLSIGQNILWFWHALLFTFGAAFVYSLFWCLSSAVYLVLRKDVDDMEMDEISIQEEKRSYELPKLQSSETEPVPQLQSIKPNPKTGGHTSDSETDDNSDPPPSETDEFTDRRDNDDRQDNTQ
jgi:hypothetical protein